jgi:hypothetical protein
MYFGTTSSVIDLLRTFGRRTQGVASAQIEKARMQRSSAMKGKTSLSCVKIGVPSSMVFSSSFSLVITLPISPHHRPRVSTHSFTVSGLFHGGEIYLTMVSFDDHESGLDQLSPWRSRTNHVF